MQAKDAGRARQRCALFEDVGRVSFMDIAILTLVKNDIFDGAVAPDCFPLAEFKHRRMIDAYLWCLRNPWDLDVEANLCSFGAASA